MDGAVAEDDVRAVDLLNGKAISAQDIHHDAVLLEPIGGDQREAVEQDAVGVVGHSVNVTLPSR